MSRLRSGAAFASAAVWSALMTLLLAFGSAATMSVPPASHQATDASYQPIIVANRLALGAEVPKHNDDHSSGPDAVVVPASTPVEPPVLSAIILPEAVNDAIAGRKPFIAARPRAPPAA